MAIFNPHPRVQTLAIDGRALCYVIDDALLEPERWVEHAAARSADFVDAPHNAYPGLELRLPEPVTEELHRYFNAHLKRHFGARRILRGYSRLSLTTRKPDELDPRQWLCHVDRLEMEPGQGIAACVLYLFHEPALGGTGFYRPLRPAAETAELVKASSRMPGAAFSAKYGIEGGYMTRSNAYFEKLHAVPARWNRLVFYSGMIFHGADITASDLLVSDARTGRLTLNGFLLYRRNLA